jgi:exonuclease VII large subunit
LTEQAHRLLSAAGQAHRRAERRLAVARGDLMAASPRRGADQWRLLWGQCRDRLLAGQARYFADRAGRIEVLGDRLGAGSHESILRRGFSITTMVTNRRVVRRARDVRSGDKVQTRTAEGSFTSRVADDRQPELFDDEPA